MFLVGDALSHCFVSSETCWVLGLQLLQPVLISPPSLPLIREDIFTLEGSWQGTPPSELGENLGPSPRLTLPWKR